MNRGKEEKISDFRPFPWTSFPMRLAFMQRFILCLCFWYFSWEFQTLFSPPMLQTARRPIKPSTIFPKIFSNLPLLLCRIRQKTTKITFNVFENKLKDQTKRDRQSSLFVQSKMNILKVPLTCFGDFYHHRIFFFLHLSSAESKWVLKTSASLVESGPRSV